MKNVAKVLKAVKDIAEAEGINYDTLTEITITADGDIKTKHIDDPDRILGVEVIMGDGKRLSLIGTDLEGKTVPETGAHSIEYGKHAAEAGRDIAMSLDEHSRLESKYDGGLHRTVGISVTVDKDKSTAEVGREIKKALDAYLKMGGTDCE